jgi:hypothetical protein
MMQYVTCNKYPYLHQDLKYWKKIKEKTNLSLWNKKKIQVFLKWETDSSVYEIEAWTTLQCNLNRIWMKIQIHWKKFELNWIELNWIK